MQACLSDDDTSEKQINTKQEQRKNCFQSLSLKKRYQRKNKLKDFLEKLFVEDCILFHEEK